MSTHESINFSNGHGRVNVCEDKINIIMIIMM